MIEFTVGMLTAAQNELEEWAGSLQDQIKRVTAAYQQAKISLESRISYIQSQISQINNELELADRVLEINNKREIQFKKQIEDNKKTIETSKQEIVSLQSQKSAAEGDKSSYDNQIANLGSAIKKLEAENVELKQKITLIHENRDQIYSIKSTLRTTKEKCETYLAKLKSAKERLNDSFSYFRDKIAPYVLGQANDEILPKMNQVIMYGTYLANAMMELGNSSGTNSLNVLVSVASGSAFRQQASNLDHEISAIKGKTENSTRSTVKFRNGLNDRVSQAASETVNEINKGINNILSNTFKGYVTKLQNIGALCDQYESISVNA